MNILFTVCGRAGSKGLRNKNLKLFLGKPLVYYTLSAIELYKKRYTEDIINVCLNTDSEELVHLVTKRDSEIYIVKRTPELAGDGVAKLSVIKDCLQKTEQYYAICYDIVVDLDITSPLRTVEDIKNAVDKKKAQKNIDVVFSVTDSRRNPYFNMVKENNNGTYSKVLDSQYTARQQAPAIYDMNASIYAYNADFLKYNTSGMLFDGACGVVEMKDTAVLDIDSEEDFVLLELLAQYFFEESQAFGEIKDNIIIGSVK